MKKVNPVFGLLRPSVDAHSLGIASFAQLLEDCGWRVAIADRRICDALNDLDSQDNSQCVLSWLVANKVVSVGFSYRLDPLDGVRHFTKFFHFLVKEKLHVSNGGLINQILFAGLPETCRIVEEQFAGRVSVFWGDETPKETLRVVGVPIEDWPIGLETSTAYDDARIAFGKRVIASGEYLSVTPASPPIYPEFGTRRDTLEARIRYNRNHERPPLMRAHVGPYSANRLAAVEEFKQWAKALASDGLLDILSIGTSQLSQEGFGEDWASRPNGGGVPINSIQEFSDVWVAARPMLVRTYSGTRNTLEMAEVYEKSINIAWHALSLWWFCETDGRGPHRLLDNLKNHFSTLAYIAKTGKPFEPNIPHHFAFRGGDDLTYVVSAVLAARLAKKIGLKHFVLQIMLNTPKATWGVQDLAKARAILNLIKPLRSRDFHVYLQPRAGLDYFSHDLNKAKIQLASVTALMDDIEPRNCLSPDIIHVVSYSEAAFLANPPVINESIKITRAAFTEYRNLRQAGGVADMHTNEDVALRTEKLVHGATVLIKQIEKSIPNCYSPEGFHNIFWAGFLPVPQLWGARDKFEFATTWKTRMVEGACCLVDSWNKLITAEEHADVCAQILSKKYRKPIQKR